MSTKYVNQNLGEYFGVVLARRTGAMALQDFAAAHPDVAEYNSTDNEVTFCTEEAQFIIRTDLNEELEVVYQGIYRVFCPQRDLATEYRTTIAHVLMSLKALLAKLE